MMIKDYTVFNPHFIPDVIRFLGLTLSESEVEGQINRIEKKYPLTSKEQTAGELTNKEKLNAFVDRIEFINHLELLAQYAIRAKFKILGQEVVGLHWDIKSLRLYLSLTCIDIFRRESKHRDRFHNIFTGTSQEIKDKWQANVIISPTDSTTTDLDEIAEYLYNIRNYYTHAGKRFYILENININQAQNFPVGNMKNKKIKTLVLASGFSLIDSILELVVYDIKKLFEWVH